MSILIYRFSALPVAAKVTIKLGQLSSPKIKPGKPQKERGGGPGPVRHPEEDLEARGEDLGLVGVPEFSSGRRSQGGEGLGVSEKTGQLKESRQAGRKKSPKLYQSHSKDAWNVTSCLRLAEAQEERAQDLLEESTSDRSSSIQEEEGTRSLQASVDTRSLLRELQDEKVADLLHFMVLKYRLKEPFTKAEMLKVVSKKYKNQFSVIFKKASKCLEVISGIDVKEVDPKIHSYVLVNSLDLTHDEMVSDDQSMPKNGLLVIILGVIFIEGNCAPEENIWDFLNMLGVYAGRKHFILGEPRKLITRDWVQENYLEYRKVPNSDPPRYEFLWGPRAYAETSKLKVLEFLAKIKGTDPISFSYWYEEALRDDEESRGHSWPLG
ncbi:melanoma-associated antigen 9-like [Balaenoptera musculus]|uniref:Melanoma-associated antigen 9-like n=1 Tax=Balaenoptera musculus TaxID=9771 RepID=A0A8B8WDK2_BALMU|nr:melanoma-associated antigen 9-like [Balaenoptera musculus]